MDHIRVPVDSPLIASDTDREHFSEEGLSWIDRAAAWTRAAGLTLVLDLHHLPGHGFMSEETNTIWTPGVDRRQALALWTTLATRYRGQSHVVFELLNEPVAPEGQDELWHALARDLIAAIRAVNQENWIMVGSNRWSNVSTFGVLPKFDDERVIYTFHLYEPFLFTHQRASWVVDDIKNLQEPVPYPGPLPRALLTTDWLVKQYGWMADQPYGEAFLRERLAPVLAFRNTYRVPVYCGEFGVLDTAPDSDRRRWYRDVVGIFRSESIGFANWNYKSDNFGLVNRKGVADPSLVQAIGASAASAGQRNSVTLFDESGDVGAVQQPGSVASTGRDSFELSGFWREHLGRARRVLLRVDACDGRPRARCRRVIRGRARGSRCGRDAAHSSPQGGLDGPGLARARRAVCRRHGAWRRPHLTAVPRSEGCAYSRGAESRTARPRPSSSNATAMSSRSK